MPAGPVTRLLTSARASPIGAAFLRGAGSTFALRITGQGATFLLMVVLARSMGVAAYGEFLYAFAWLNTLVVVPRAGFDSALVRYVAEYRATEAWGLLRGVLRHSERFVLACSVIVAAAACAATLALRHRLPGSLLTTFMIAWLTLPILAVTALQQASLRGLMFVARSQVPEVLLRPVLLATGAVAAQALLGRRLEAPTLMVLNLLAFSCCLLLGAYWVRRLLPLPARTAAPEVQARLWIRVALPLLAVSAFHLLLGQTDTLLVGALLSPAEAGIYRTSASVAQLLLLGPAAAGAVAAPMISGYYAQRQTENIQRMLRIASGVLLAFALPLSAVLILGGRFVLSLFGAEFTAGYPVLVLLTCGYLVNTACGPAGFMMTMTGGERVVARVLGICAVVNVLLNLALIPRLGSIGAALASSLSMAAWNLALVYFIRRDIGVNSSIFCLLQFRRRAADDSGAR